MNTQTKRFALIVLAFAIACVAALVGIAGQQAALAAAPAEEPAAEEAQDGEGQAAEEGAEPAEGADAEAAPAAEGVSVSAEQVEAYCGMCHFKDVENMAISSWNKTNIDFAMVESMVPMLDDDTIQGVVDYFGAIEPPAQEGGPR